MVQEGHDATMPGRPCHGRICPTCSCSAMPVPLDHMRSCGMPSTSAARRCKRSITGESVRPTQAVLLVRVEATYPPRAFLLFPTDDRDKRGSAIDLMCAASSALKNPSIYGMLGRREG
eukprot:scaffold1804_cov263-Pinguiococcus_pyrenoidosus.AAC.23